MLLLQDHTSTRSNLNTTRSFTQFKVCYRSIYYKCSRAHKISNPARPKSIHYKARFWFDENQIKINYSESGFFIVNIDKPVSRQTTSINLIPPDFYNLKQGKQNIWVGPYPPNILVALFHVINIWRYRKVPCTLPAKTFIDKRYENEHFPKVDFREMLTDLVKCEPCAPNFTGFHSSTR